jgi:hypothetical protein
MKINTNLKTSKVVKRITLDFNIKGIMRDFYSIDEPVKQGRFIEKKLEELIQADSVRSRLGLFSKMKMAFLVDYLHMDLILNGLKRMANKDLEILLRTQE